MVDSISCLEMSFGSTFRFVNLSGNWAAAGVPVRRRAARGIQVQNARCAISSAPKGAILETKILHARIARQSPSSFLGICLALALLAAVRNSSEFLGGVDFCSGRHVSRSIALSGRRFPQSLRHTK